MCLRRLSLLPKAKPRDEQISSRTSFDPKIPQEIAAVEVLLSVDMHSRQDDVSVRDVVTVISIPCESELGVSQFPTSNQQLPSEEAVGVNDVEGTPGLAMGDAVEDNAGVENVVGGEHPRQIVRLAGSGTFLHAFSSRHLLQHSAFR